MIVNNTRSDIRLVETSIRESIIKTGEIPEELRDTFAVRKVVGYENRWVLDWA